MPITPNAAYNTNYTYDAGVAPSVIKFYERNFMKEVMPELIHNRDAQKRTLPLNNGKTVQFTRITELPVITTTLVEGVTPDGQKLTETAFTAMVKPYGGYVAVTDEFNWYLLGNKHKEASESLSRQAALSGLSFQGKPLKFKLCDTWGTPIPEEELYRPHDAARCRECGMQLVCSGCSDCGRCSR